MKLIKLIENNIKSYLQNIIECFAIYRVYGNPN